MAVSGCLIFEMESRTQLYIPWHRASCVMYSRFKQPFQFRVPARKAGNKNAKYRRASLCIYTFKYLIICKLKCTGRAHSISPFHLHMIKKKKKKRKRSANCNNTHTHTHTDKNFLSYFSRN